MGAKGLRGVALTWARAHDQTPGTYRTAHQAWTARLMPSAPGWVLLENLQHCVGAHASCTAIESCGVPGQGQTGCLSCAMRWQIKPASDQKGVAGFLRGWSHARRQSALSIPANQHGVGHWARVSKYTAAGARCTCHRIAAEQRTSGLVDCCLGRSAALRARDRCVVLCPGQCGVQSPGSTSGRCFRLVGTLRSVLCQWRL